MNKMQCSALNWTDVQGWTKQEKSRVREGAGERGGGGGGVTTTMLNLNIQKTGDRFSYQPGCNSTRCQSRDWSETLSSQEPWPVYL